MKRIVTLLLLTFHAGVFIFAQANLQPVAIVRLTRSEPITVRELRTEMEKVAWPNLGMRLGRLPTAAELTAEVQNSSIDARRQVLEAMINERLALQAAERDRVSVSDNEVNQQITQMRAEMAQGIGRQPTDSEFATAIREEFGQDLPAFRESLKRQLIVQKYLTTTKQHLFNSIREPTPQEITAQYNLLRAQLVRPDTVRFSMIEVPFGADAASKTRAKELADRLNREIGTNPSRFDEAVLRAQAPNSGYRAGDGGYLPQNTEARQLVGAEFLDTAFSLRQGQVSGVIETRQGYHIIKVTETLPLKAPLELDELVFPGRPGTVRQLIVSNMMQQQQYQIMARATQELAAELRAGNPFQIMENQLNW